MYSPAGDALHEGDHGVNPIPNTLAAVIFDWAGTVMDFGSRAPMGAFVRLLAAQDIEISVDEARVPMGLPKWDHIRALLDLPRVAAAWRRVHGRPADDADVDTLYEAFTPMSVQAAVEHAQIVPGAAHVVAALRRRGLRIGSTTGYHAPIIAAVAPLLAAQGFAPDNCIRAGDVEPGRPSALAIYQCFVDLHVWPAWRVVKVDDTVPGLLEGRHAGCWTVAVAVSGNANGLALDEWLALDAAGQAARRTAAAAALAEAGPHYTIDSVAELMPVLDDIEARLGRGERPAG
jgi:phosphonoacetaldehyde hydrolase